MAAKVTVTTTIAPGTPLEVSEQEATDLRRMGYLRDDKPAPKKAAAKRAPRKRTAAKTTAAPAGDTPTGSQG